MQRYVVLEKALGETPLGALQHWKRANPSFRDVSAAYAGRLDPMASGKLLVLLGEECKRHKLYTGLDKEYEIEVLLDVGSDTGDILGIVESSGANTALDMKTLQKALDEEHGSRLVKYPVYSSKTVKGKPLFMYTLEGTLADISVPEHLETLYRVELQGFYTIRAKELEEKVESLLTLAPQTSEPSKSLGEDFRIDAVRASWRALGLEKSGRVFLVLKLRVVCGSGTYMRSLAGRIGEALGTEGLAFSIRRTKIGKYVPLWKSFDFWMREY